MTEMWAKSAWNTCWTYKAEKLPDDVTLVPKHVRVGTCYGMYFVIYFIIM